MERLQSPIFPTIVQIKCLLITGTTLAKKNIPRGQALGLLFIGAEMIQWTLIKKKLIRLSVQCKFEY